MKRKYEEVIIDGESVLMPTKAWRQKQIDASLRSKLLSSGLPLHVSSLSFDDYIGEDRAIPEKLKKYVSQFPERYSSIHLYFWSHDNGTQKTTMAGILGKELVLKGYDVRFVLMGSLLSLLSSFNKDDEEDHRIQELMNCDLLIIDDSFDTKKATIYKSGYQISFLDIFLRERLEVKRKATCFTSNFFIEEINEDIFGKSLKKLIHRNIIDPFHFNVSYAERNVFDAESLWGED